jgi:sporulation protein YunB
MQRAYLTTSACRRPGRRFSPRRWAARLCLLAALLLYGLFCVERHIRPVLLTVVQYESSRYANAAFNDAIADNIAEDPDSYEGLYHVTCNAAGDIVSVQADPLAMNRLASRLTQRVEAELNAQEGSCLDVPVGTLLGVQALAGRGPELHLRVLPEFYVTSQIYDRLESAGINRTKLSIYVHFTLCLSVLMSGYSTSVTEENEICLTQILLAGDTPNVLWGGAAAQAGAAG